MKFIYLYQNKINLKVYVGQTKNIRSRYYQHKNIAKSNYNHPFYNALRKYGLDNFDMIKLEEVPDNEIDDAEVAWIKCFNSTNRDYGYNISSGGYNHIDYDEEVRNKISIARKNYFLTHENPFKGKHHTEETKQFLSDLNKGRIIPEEIRLKMSISHIGENNHMYGKQHSEETRKKISEANAGKCYNTPEHMKMLHKMLGDRLRGKPLSDEAKARLLAANKGKKHSLESCKKMSETRKLRGTFAGKNNPNYGKHGELHHLSKFTWEIIRNIRLDYENGIRGKKLMEKYNISETHMYRIIKNKSWKIENDPLENKNYVCT